MILTSDITVGGTLLVTGTLRTNGHATTFSGIDAQTIGGSAMTTFAGLTINNTMGVTLTDGAAVTGTLNLQAGNLTVTGPALDFSGTSTGEGDVVGATRRRDVTPGTPYPFGNGMIALTFGASGTIPSGITVTLAMTAPAGISNSILRTYDITETGGSSFTTTLRLRYLESDLRPGMKEEDLNIYRREAGGSWTEVSVSRRSVAENWLETANITHFSEWTAGNNTPTAVGVRVFKARSGS
jgi:hypothetical protein